MDTGFQTQREEAGTDLNPGKFGRGPAIELNVSVAKYIYTNFLLHPQSRETKINFIRRVSTPM